MRLDAAPTADSGPKKKNAAHKQVTSINKKSLEDRDVIKASQALHQADQHFASGIAGEQPILGAALGMQPDPLLLVALHVSSHNMTDHSAQVSAVQATVVAKHYPYLMLLVMRYKSLISADTAAMLR